MSRKTQKGFTAVELIIIMGILIMLAAIIIPNVQPLQRRAKAGKAKSDIARLENAIQSYANDFGKYPNANDNATLVRLLIDSAAYSANPRWKGPYIELKQGEELVSGQFVDPWGTAYRYKFQTLAHNPGFVEIYSCGPDMLNNNGALDDINNWSK